MFATLRRAHLGGMVDQVFILPVIRIERPARKPRLRPAVDLSNVVDLDAYRQSVYAAGAAVTEAYVHSLLAPLAK